MVAIENDSGIFEPGQGPRRWTATLALGGVAVALVVAVAAFAVHGGERNGARYATEMVLRASSLAFVLYFVASSAARLVPSPATAALGRERLGLALAFAGSYAVFLACIVAPSYLTDTRLALSSTAFCVFSTLILAVLLLGAQANESGSASGRAWRVMASLAVGYFWLAFALSNLDYVVGPHRADYFHGFALCLLVTAVLVRIVDSFARRRRVRLAEKEG